jgi:AcrR family transcriptional regulator
MGMREPAYRRLTVDQRRRRLLDVGSALFGTHAFDELSMAEIARRAGISKALLYHYFPSKEAFFVAALEQQAGELQALTRTDPTRPLQEQIAESLTAFLAWIERHADEYRGFLRSAGTVPQVRAAVDGVRRDVVDRIVDGLGRRDDPRSRMAAQGWLGFVERAAADWIEHRDVERAALRDLMLDTLAGAMAAAAPPAERAG